MFHISRQGTSLFLLMAKLQRIPRTPIAIIYYSSVINSKPIASGFGNLFGRKYFSEYLNLCQKNAVSLQIAKNALMADALTCGTNN
jgi:hypothetical protein